MPRYARDPQWNDLRYTTTCARCGEPIHKGERAFYFPSVRKYYGNRCGCGLREDAAFQRAAFDESVMTGEW